MHLKLKYIYTYRPPLTTRTMQHYKKYFKCSTICRGFGHICISESQTIARIHHSNQILICFAMSPCQPLRPSVLGVLHPREPERANMLIILFLILQNGDSDLTSLGQ